MAISKRKALLARANARIIRAKKEKEARILRAENRILLAKKRKEEKKK
jgi:hypothetical protein